MFGGLTGDTVLSDVWVADVTRPGRPRWEQLCAAMSCGAGPSPRWGGHAVYDPADDRLVVFGGLSAGGVTTNDVWALDLSGAPGWTELSVDGARPAARWSAAYGFDPVGRRLVVFGGQTGPDASGTSLDDTWALSLDGEPTWTELGTAGAAPAARRSPAGAVRVTADGAELIVATGYTPSTGQHHDDVWSLDLRLGVVGRARRRRRARRSRSAALGVGGLRPGPRPARDGVRARRCCVQRRAVEL